jgi:hypothetical protein
MDKSGENYADLANINLLLILDGFALACAGMPKTSFRKNSDSPAVGDREIRQSEVRCGSSARGRLVVIPTAVKLLLTFITLGFAACG